MKNFKRNNLLFSLCGLNCGLCPMKVKLEKENRRLKKENDFLEEASAFFAASRLKSAKTKE